MTLAPAKLVIRDEVDPVRWMGEQGRFLLRKEDTGGLYTFMEITTPPDGGPPLHIHDTEDEAFFVTEGKYEIRVDGELHVATPGTLAYGPRGVAHQFRNISDAPSRMLVIVTPGGVEDFFIGLSELLRDGRRPEWEEMVAHATKHNVRGFRPMGGPPAGIPGGPGAGMPRRPGAGAPGVRGPAS
ncbi:cupin domain-containing protein [Actinoallomurus sp. CA-150999]|uniref:cupin domain-containing protein n=1 Tax=Actinoallomurus sp. CA-150999 TaxID=3239887 RepID=UPI003D8EFD7D